eukprot:CAMPEP_0197873944 /NCGR_PEP_ID=MMETSP1439-20131203/3585_1 /TAXON_ID=66791 /ORGANISM="Gonyaulax spinifera, Strain CCMP409" /LENGTH=572 /DNA_ID=CAMNT_0043493021 /DNA_START=56 /DNA_END=1774 /DNA_ORIENTATION=-
MAEKDPKIKAILDALEYDVDEAQRLAQEVVSSGDSKLVVEAKGALVSIYLAKGMLQEALGVGSEAYEMSKTTGNRALEAGALNALAVAMVSQESPNLEQAMSTASGALAIYGEVQDSVGQTEVYRTMMSMKLIDKKNPEARQVALDAAAAFKAAGDAKGEAAAQLLLAEACMVTLKSGEASAAAHEALRLSQAVEDKAGEAAALLAIVSAELTSPSGKAVWAAGERVTVFKYLEDRNQEASALVLLAQAHVASIGLKMATCSIPSSEDTMGGLKSAKDAFSLHADLGNRDGMDAALGLFSRVLMYNGVPASVIETATDPEEIFQDVMSGKFTTSTNAFPPKPQLKQLKVEEIIPSSKQLDRGKFTWIAPISGFSYTLIWQAVKDRDVKNKKPRGSYDILTMNTGTKTNSLAQAFTAMSNDAAERNQSMVIYMTSHDCAKEYASSIITQQSTLACMITARLSKITFVQLGEGHYDWTDIRARQVSMYPVTLALMRSCRIEAPTVNIGYVAGDAASWIADPAPLIENLFDTLESDECEMIYKRGEAFGPLIVHRPMEEGVTFVKPKKPHNFMKM